MRLFFATYLSRENMGTYGSLVDGLVGDHPRVLRSVPRHTQHLTLAFLGELAESEAEFCARLLDRVSSFEAFDYLLGVPSLLMSRGRPRLVRADVTAGDDRIRSIQEALVSGTRKRISGLDTRPKPPHVTLARFRKNSSRSPTRLVEEALARIPPSSWPSRDSFQSVRLVRSTLTPSGPQYETIHEVSLTADNLA